MSHNVTPSDVARFFAKTEPSGDCLLWTGSGGRYGRFYLCGEMVGAHRVAWIIAHGPIPDGLNVLHSCDCPRCVNVSHLFLGTQLDNVRDMLAKGRQGDRGAHLRGELSRYAKLTSDDVMVLRAVHRRGQGGNTLALAEQYNVAPQTILAAVAGRTWRNI